MEVGFIEGIVGVDWGIVVVVHWGMLVDRLSLKLIWRWGFIRV